MIDLNLPLASRNRYSQAGEELIVEQFLSLTGSQTQLIMCEFGAHNGQNSNLLRLCEDRIAGLIFIECSKARYSELESATRHLSDLVLLHEMVGWDHEKSLKSIFQRHNLLIEQVRIWSIDIDGDDYHIFEDLPSTADMVIIEYNPTFAFDVEFVNPQGTKQGSSPLALCNLAARKHMFLAAMTDTNLIFVQTRFAHLVKSHRLSDLCPTPSTIRLALGYDGTLIVTNGAQKDLTDEVLGLGWTKAFFPQPLPRFLRKFNSLELAKVTFSLVRLLFLRPWLIRSLLFKYKHLRENRHRLD